jgi:hypothetical protein
MFQIAQMKFQYSVSIISVDPTLVYTGFKLIHQGIMKHINK